MAEITRITSPLVPHENLGNRNKPISDQAFDLSDPTKVHRAGNDGGKILDQQKENQAALQMANRQAMGSVLRPVNELMQAVQRITMMLQMGISTSDMMAEPEIQNMMESLFLSPEQLAQALKEQDASAVLFKGDAFDLLREIVSKFPENPKVQGAVSNLLKVFDHSVNAENSIKTILLTCNNLLDYMFSGDKAQFSQYLEGLAQLLLPDGEKAAQGEATVAEEALPQTLETEAAAQTEKGAAVLSEKAVLPEEAQAEKTQDGAPKSQDPETDKQSRQAEGEPGRGAGLERKEAAQILKSNLLPLLGEIVVKYNQNERIRDMVMVVVHNIVRVDQGTPESLDEAISKLVAELKLVANLPEGFEEKLADALRDCADQVKDSRNDTLSKLTSIVSETLSSGKSTPASVRQAENLLMSMLQNQSAVMDVLHFILPMETEFGKLFAEMYVDPDSEDKVGKSGERSRKIFLSFESEGLGAFELGFLETGARVDFQMWCPDVLVKSLSGIKRQIGDIMQLHGYTMNSYEVAELVAPKTIADVFPNLLNRRTSVDVRI